MEGSVYEKINEKMLALAGPLWYKKQNYYVHVTKVSSQGSLFFMLFQG